MTCLHLNVSETTPVVKAAMFASNDKTVVLNCSNGRQYAFAVESGRVKSSFGPVKDGTYSVVSEQPIHKLMQFIPNNRFLSPGLSHDNSNVLYVHNFSAAETIAGLSGHGCSIDIVATNMEQTLAASASSTEVAIDGVAKYVWVWDLLRYCVFSRCAKDGPHSMVSFCGSHDDLLLTAGQDNSPMTVWYIGTSVHPVNPAVAVHTLAGQRKVQYVETVLSKNLLITAALDNTIKVWDLEVLADRCHRLVTECGTNLEVIVAEKDRSLENRPYEPGEGLLTTLSTAISKSVTLLKHIDLDCCGHSKLNWSLFKHFFLDIQY